MRVTWWEWSYKRSGLIRGLTFGGRGLTRVALDGSGLIRGMVFVGSGFMKG